MKPLGILKNLQLRSVIIAFMLVVFVLSYNSPSQAWAQDKDTKSFTNEEVVERYGLKNAEVIPIGVTPLEFSTPQELESFLALVNNNTIKPSHTEYREKNIVDKSSFMAAVTSYGVVTRNCSSSVAIGTNFNTWGDIRVATSGSFRWIDSVLSTYTGLTGLTLGFELANPYSYSYNKTTSSVSVKGGGIVNVYILVDGFIKVYSSPVSCSFTYSVY